MTVSHSLTSSVSRHNSVPCVATDDESTSVRTGVRFRSIHTFGDETISTERLTVPYHYLDRREYALRPLAEVAGDYRHPALGLTPREMLAALTGEEKVYE